MAGDERFILLAEDDEDDVLLIREALAEAGVESPLVRVCDGVELMAYLRQDAAVAAARPAFVVLLDLNMPRKDGREALREIRGDPQLRHIPVIALTTSRSSEDIRNSYAVGVNSYIVKPHSFRALADTLRTFGQYWFSTVELPA